jgi:hypothetical protein
MRRSSRVHFGGTVAVVSVAALPLAGYAYDEPLSSRRRDDADGPAARSNVR